MTNYENIRLSFQFFIFFEKHDLVAETNSSIAYVWFIISLGHMIVYKYFFENLCEIISIMNEVKIQNDCILKEKCELDV